jgi:hypothetical protein
MLFSISADPVCKTSARRWARDSRGMPTTGVLAHHGACAAGAPIARTSRSRRQVIRSASEIVGAGRSGSTAHAVSAAANARASRIVVFASASFAHARATKRRAMSFLPLLAFTTAAAAWTSPASSARSGRSREATLQSASHASCASHAKLWLNRSTPWRKLEVAEHLSVRDRGERVEPPAGQVRHHRVTGLVDRDPVHRMFLAA